MAVPPANSNHYAGFRPRMAWLAVPLGALGGLMTSAAITTIRTTSSSMSLAAEVSPDLQLGMYAYLIVVNISLGLLFYGPVSFAVGGIAALVPSLTLEKLLQRRAKSNSTRSVTSWFRPLAVTAISGFVVG